MKALFPFFDVNVMSSLKQVTQSITAAESMPRERRDELSTLIDSLSDALKHVEEGGTQLTPNEWLKALKWWFLS